MWIVVFCIYVIAEHMYQDFKRVCVVDVRCSGGWTRCGNICIQNLVRDYSVQLPLGSLWLIP